MVFSTRKVKGIELRPGITRWKLKVLRETESRNIPLKLLVWARAPRGERGWSQEHGACTTQMLSKARELRESTETESKKQQQ